MYTEAEEKKQVPEDLMFEIALRLPIQSIGRLKCVSKPWNCFLTTPDFVKSHFQHAPERIILDDGYCSLHVITLDDHNGGRSRAVKLPLPDDNTNRPILLNCCNGLALLKLNSSLVVMNPVTLKYMILTRKFNVYDKVLYSLGYNSAEDDYKFVEFAYSEKFVKIFSLKTRSFKQYSVDIPYHAPSEYYTLYADGRFYWYNDSDRVIIAFDLSTEKCEQVPIPTDFGSRDSGFLKQLGGCFAIVGGFQIYGDRQINVWIMEKLGDWRKFTISDYPKSNDEYPNYFDYYYSYEVINRLGEFEFVVAVNVEKLVAYNCETKVWRTLNIDGLPNKHFWGILNFRESLVCP